MREILGKPNAGELEILRLSEPTVEENLALDESLAREAGLTGRRVVRLWWGSRPTVVVGCAEKPEVVLDLDECARRKIGWIKRITGGGTVVQTPDVFNYTYTAPDSGRLDIRQVFEQGASLLIGALDRLGVKAEMKGISDVAVDEMKISGNAQARKWKSVLLHGTLLVDMDFELVEAILKHPPREPDYRRGRLHGEFLTTLRRLKANASRRKIELAVTESALRVFGANRSTPTSC